MKSKLMLSKVANTAVNSLFSLWKNNDNPKLLDILNNIAKSKLFVIRIALKLLRSVRIRTW